MDKVEKVNEVWSRLKSDDAKVYGEPILDMFLKMTDVLERRHWDELPESKRDMVDPQVELAIAQNPAEAERAIKKGASDLWTAAQRMIDRDEPDMALFLIARIPNKGILKDGQRNKNAFLSYAIEGAKERSVKALIRAGAKPSHDDLEAAAGYAGVEIARELIKSHPDLDVHRALDQAARIEDYEIFEFLADELAKDPDYEPEIDLADALGSAAQFGRIRKIEFLLDREAGGLGDALKSAAKGFARRKDECVKVIEILLKHGAEAEDAILWASVHLGPLDEEDRVLNALTGTPTSLRTAQRLAERSQNVRAYLQRRASRNG